MSAGVPEQITLYTSVSEISFGGCRRRAVGRVHIASTCFASLEIILGVCSDIIAGTSAVLFQSIAGAQWERHTLQHTTAAIACGVAQLSADGSRHTQRKLIDALVANSQESFRLQAGPGPSASIGARVAVHCCPPCRACRPGAVGQ